jgi:inosine-uridine nucleoside N-ribohydrolase
MALAAAGLTLGAPAARAGAGPAKPPIPIIIDTDIGDDIDDAFAVGVALSDPRLEVLGITSAWGDTHKRVLLIRRLLEAAGRSDIPVAEGVATTGTAALAQARWAEGEKDTAPAPNAIAFIAEQIRRRPGQMTLVELAPMSNLQALIQRYPDVLPKLKQIVFMGGGLYAGYYKGGAVPNPVPDAEYNVAVAPGALAAVLGTGVPMVMFPLDSTQLKFDEVQRDRLFAHGSGLSDAITLLYHQWRLNNGLGQITPTLFDAIPVVWLLEPGLCPVTPLRIAVDAKGYTRPVAGSANLRACLALHEDGARTLINNALAPEAPDQGPKVSAGQ